MDCATFVEMPLNRRHVQEKASEPKQAVVVAQSPHSLIARAQTGDLQAFNQLVEDKQALAYNMARRILQSQEAAADAVQESLIKAYRALGSYRGGSFQAWFMRILINTCYDLLRVQKREKTVGLDDLPTIPDYTGALVDAAEGPEAYIQRLELWHWLTLGLRALSPEQRIAIILHDVQGYSYEEVAAVMDTPLGTVKSRLNRGRLELRDFLSRHEVLPTRV